MLAPDARAHGESLRRVRSDGGYDFETDRANTLDGWPTDVAAAVAWLTARGDIDLDRIGVGGASVGANTAWIASSIVPAVRRAVAVSGRFEPGRLLMGEDIPNFQPRGVLFQSDREEALQSQALYSRTAEPRRVSGLRHPRPRHPTPQAPRSPPRLRRLAGRGDLTRPARQSMLRLTEADLD